MQLEKLKQKYILHRAFIEVTGDCNCGGQPCVYCRNFGIADDDRFVPEDKTNLTTDDIKKRIDDVIELGASEVVLTGGEPLLRADIVDIIQYCSENRLSTLVATNGRKVTSGFLEQIQNYDGVRIQVSLDSMDEKINDALRGKGSYDAAIRAIYLIKEHNVPLQISTTLTSENISCIRELVDSFPTDYIKLRRLVGEGLAKSRPDLSVGEEELEEILQGIVLNPVYGSRVAVEQVPYVVDCDGLSHVYSCSAGNSILYIKANGDVTPCPSVSDVVGNLTQTTLKEIWENKLDGYRDKYKSSGYCGRNSLLLSGEESLNPVPDNNVKNYEEFKECGCKCTG